MATEAVARPLDAVLRPGSPAEAALCATALAPGYEPEPGLDLRWFGGRTLAHLRFALVYCGLWESGERELLDRAIGAAMADRHLNNVVAQYFPRETVSAELAGSQSGPAVPHSVDQARVERLVADLAASPGTALCLLLPRGVVLRHGEATSRRGLAGFHGSVHLDGETVYYAVAVYSEGTNGIVSFSQPWMNVCATLYHELQEIRTDPDVGDAIRTGRTDGVLGWYSPRGGEIGDIALVMDEVPLADGGSVPIQLMWSNAVHGPEGPVTRRRAAARRTRPAR